MNNKQRMSMLGALVLVPNVAMAAECSTTASLKPQAMTSAAKTSTFSLTTAKTNVGAGT
jgi:hypothetical protein